MKSPVHRLPAGTADTALFLEGMTSVNPNFEINYNGVSMSDPWKSAVMDACACHHAEFNSHDPYGTLKDLLEIAGVMALDPRISVEAQALIDQGMQKGVEIGRAEASSSKTAIQEGSGVVSGVTVSADIYWRYDKPPLGTKIFILTEGGIAIIGNWVAGAGFKAWFPLPRRDKELEERLML